METQEHLTKPEQYALVHRRGRSWAGGLLVMKLLPNGLTLSRYGFVVSKRVGKAAVRNRLKRRLREILRSRRLKPGWDVVFIAHPRAAGASFADLKKLISSLLARAQLLMENYEKACLRTN